MADKSVTYNGSHIIQSDQPSGGYVCSEQDNARFQADLNQDGVVKAFFTNTHQPTETDDAEWKKVELNWTRSVNMISNLVDVHIATGTDYSSDLTGFIQGGSGTVTLSSSTDWAKNGTRSLKIVCDGSATNQGYNVASVAYRSIIVSGTTYTGSATVQGVSGTIMGQLAWYDSSGTFISQITSSDVTLDGTDKTVTITGTAPSNAFTCKMVVVTASAQAITFYVDEIIIIQENSIPKNYFVDMNTGDLVPPGYNLLSQNQSNCGGDGTTEGFYLYSCTVSVDTINYYEGSSSIKVVTSNLVGDEGITVNAVQAVPGTKYSGKIRIKGSGIIHLTMHCYDESGKWVNGIADSNQITLTSNWQTIDISGTCLPSTHMVGLYISTWGKQSSTFYIDTCQINVGGPAPWVEGPYGGFNSKVSLYGIMDNGNPELIGEYNNNTIFPTSATESIVFDLAGSAGEPPLIKETDSTFDGKVRLNLPMNLGNYSSIVLKHSSYGEDKFDDQWMHVKTIPFTGSSDFSYSNYTVGPYTILYDLDMNPDFSDLRFAIWDGSEYIDIPYFIFSQINSTSAKIFFNIPSLPISPNITNIYMFYGNPNATSNSSFQNVIHFYDDFDDGKLSSRTWPYGNWTIFTGSASAIVSSPISGAQSLWHMGANSGADSFPMGIWPWYGSIPQSFIVYFDFKLWQPGSGSYDPYVNLWIISYVDGNNYLKIDTYWNGTYQVVRLVKKLNGTTTVVASWNWTNSKLTTNVVHHIKIIPYLPTSGTQYVTVFIDGIKIFNAVNPNYPVSMGNCGLGCIQTAQGIWDNILIRPYIGMFVFENGNEPSIGAMTPEDTQVSPDSWDDSKQYLLFTLPSDYLANVPICFDVAEENSTVYETPDVVINPKDVYKLGLDHTSKYHALRAVVETDVTSADNVTWNYIKYDYSF